MTGVLIKRRNLDTDTHTGRTLCEDKGGDQGTASTHKGASKTPKLNEKHCTDSFSEPLERANPANTLILHF